MKTSETAFAVQQRQRTERNLSAVKRAQQQWRRQEPTPPYLAGPSHPRLRPTRRQEEDRGGDWRRGPSKSPSYRPG